MPGEDLAALPPGLDHFMHVHVIRSQYGYVIWRRGTGDNAELLWIRSFKKGHGRWLLRKMLRSLLKDPPYHTVYGITRSVNIDAQGFYDRMGFSLSKVAGVYADGDAVVFSAPFDDLCTIHEVSL